MAKKSTLIRLTLIFFAMLKKTITEEFTQGRLPLI